MSNIIELTDYQRPLHECPTYQFCFTVANNLLHQLPDFAADPKASRANRKRMKDLLKLLKAASADGDDDLVGMFLFITSHLLKKDPITPEELEDFAADAQRSKKKLEENASHIAWYIIRNLVPVMEGGSVVEASPEIH